jgi:glutamate-ammonia-ligase adenylyltransferase
MSGAPILLPSLLPWLRPGGEPLPDPFPLTELGLLEPGEASRMLQRMGRGLLGPAWAGGESHLARALAAASDPDRALAALERLEDPDLVCELCASEEGLSDLARVMATGGFAAGLFLRWPDDVRWLLLEGGVQEPADRGVEALVLPALRDRPSLLSALNRLRRREQLRMVARAALGLGTLEEEFFALSRLSERIVDHLIDRLWPPGLARPAVIALGKLGGCELNFSSDLDLLFALEIAEGTPVTEVLPPVTAATETVVGALTEYTSEGGLYRIDLRLRPAGDRAPLVRSVRGLEAWYARHGAPWERQMLVKARVCAGESATGRDLIDRLVPFVFPTHAEQDPREEAHRHRRERRAREGGAPSPLHVKLAAGGIRDVEFIVQVLQLLYGGRHPEVRTPTTLEALARLLRAGLLPETTAMDLEAAYRFLRRLEHLLQMEEDRQTFTLPESVARRRALARLMGLADGAALLTAYDTHRERVGAALHALVPGAGETEDGEPVESLLNLPPGGVEAGQRLRRRGFREGGQTHRVLTAAGAAARAEGSSAWAAYIGLLPPLLEDAARTGAPDRALNNLERILRRLGSIGAYTRLLAREAPLRRALLTLCASGELLTDLLVRHPEHFERLFSTQAAGGAADPHTWRQRLRAERRAVPGSPELARRLEGLRCRETLAAGIAYVTGEAGLEPTMQYLARVARDLLRVFLGSHFRDFLRPPRVGVLALGTLADGAMSFASDADLLFLHTEGEGPTIQGLAGKAAGLLTPPGGPYAVDLRLRPEGRSAPTSIDLAYLRAYLEERASPWEALALGRLRPLYGRHALLSGAVTLVESWLEGFRLDEATRASLREVRRLQEAESARESARSGPAFDTKRSPGAMVDLEYLATALTLDGRRRGRPRPAGVPAMLRALAADGRLDPGEAEWLTAFYLRLRRIQMGLQLHFGRDVTRLPADWGENPVPVVLSGQSPAALAEAAARVRERFERNFPG